MEGPRSRRPLDAARLHALGLGRLAARGRATLLDLTRAPAEPEAGPVFRRHRTDVQSAYLEGD